MRCFPSARAIRMPVSLLALLLVASGCHSFNREWKQAAGQPTPPNDIQGRWQGTWKSDSSGHTDKLRCLITREDNQEYTARFHAKYHKLLSFSYTVPLEVEKTGDEFKFSGEADLGWKAGGVYHYEGHANATNFFANYTSKYDHGIFQMTRP
jgi:hypothetical protein